MSALAQALYSSEIIGDSYCPDYDQSGPMPLARHAQCFSQNAVKLRSSIHSMTPSVAQKHNESGMKNRYVSITKTLGERVADSLKRRLFPHTSLTRKQLQYALKISTGTMDNLLSGHHDPSGRVLDMLVAFFRDGFINEVWGGHNIHCICTRAQQRADAMQRLVEAQNELRRLG